MAHTAAIAMINTVDPWRRSFTAGSRNQPLVARCRDIQLTYIRRGHVTGTGLRGCITVALAVQEDAGNAGLLELLVYASLLVALTRSGMIERHLQPRSGRLPPATRAAVVPGP